MPISVVAPGLEHSRSSDAGFETVGVMAEPGAVMVVLVERGGETL